MTEMGKAKVELAPLVARIRATFPDLAFDRATLNDLGEDHAAVMLDDAWVFRFPRGAEAASYAVGERRLLEALAGVSNLATPRYERVAPEGDFAGYRMILGEELTEARFASLPRSVQERVVDEMGAFLAVLHALPLALTAGPNGEQRPAWNGLRQAGRYAERRVAYAAILTPPLLARSDAFYAALAEVPSPRLRMVHNDFTEDHILLAPSGDRLAGVIDFTDAGPGDPAFDFTFLWAYGEWAPERAIARYGAEAEHADLIERSLWQFVRYRIEQLWWDARGFRDYDRAKILADLPDLFSRVGV
jgi:aminoglycoside phosphotransferase (APT) family kinase protein